MHSKMQHIARLWLYFGTTLLFVAIAVYFVPVLASIPIILGVYIFYSILKHYEK